MLSTTVFIKLSNKHIKVSEDEVEICNPVVQMSTIPRAIFDEYGNMHFGESSKYFYTPQEFGPIILKPSSLGGIQNKLLTEFTSADSFQEFCDNNNDMVLVLYGTLTKDGLVHKANFTGNVTNLIAASESSIRFPQLLTYCE